jgi:DNA polymerase-1
MLCIGICYAPGRAVVLAEGVLGEREVLDALGELLRSKRLIAQNGKFDLAGLYPLLGGLKLWFDTMLASYCFDERPGIHGLKFQAVEYLGAPQYDNEIKKYLGPKDGYGVIPRDVLYRYNAYDVACTYALWEMYERRFAEQPELRRVHDLLVAASNELMYVELNGIAVDRQYLQELSMEFLESLAKIEADIDSIIAPTVERKGYYDKARPINPRSPLQVKKYLADQRISVDSTDRMTIEKVLEVLVRRGHSESEPAAFCRALLKHRREAKLYGTYVKGIRKRIYRGRIYPTFLLHGTTTGRPACRNPNLLNQPREARMRRIYVPGKCTCERCQNGDRRVFVHTDGSQMELRVLTFLAQEPYFRDIFNEGIRDVFDELTPILYPGRTKENTSKADWKELRIRVKAYVYGLSYGREAFSIAQEFGLSERETQDNMKRFFGVIPKIVAFRQEVQQTVFNGEDLVTPFGRHRRFMLITKGNWKDIKKEALAFLPQSTASDITLTAFTKVRQDLKGIGWVRNVIYDAILAECHESDADQVAKVMNQRMLEAADELTGGYVKFACESTVGNNWGAV